jgi:histidyl-tRNA synthetase
MGPVWRNEKPGPGRFRQFYQCDADTVGASSVAADAEICAMLSDALEASGIARGDYLVRINNRKVLNGVLEAAEVRDDQAEDVLRQIDKFDKVGREGVLSLLTTGRLDDSILSRWRYLDEHSADLTRRDRSSIYGGVHVYELA